MGKEQEEQVLNCIAEHFDLDAVRIEDFALFPCGKKVIDAKGEEMVFYYDHLTTSVKWTFPKSIRSN